MDDFRGKRVTVAGLGRFGGQIAAARWLAEQGARVIVTDRESPEKLEDSVRQLDGLLIEFHLGGHRRKDFVETDLVVTSPAIPPHNDYLAESRRAGVLITTEIQLFIERCPTKNVLGVTGSKGKSTTSAMLGAILKQKFATHVGGNIGKPLLGELANIGADDVVVLELSSFMLEYLREMKWSPRVAVVTMLTADHVEWHGSLDAYVDAKANLLRFQAESDWAVMSAQCAERLRSFTRARVTVVNGDEKSFELTLPGKHNQLNAQLAFAAARVLGISWDAAQSALRDFRALPHRLELVHEADGVRWVNDSIATIPEAAIAALESFPAGKVIQIVGGYDKHLPMDAMCDALAKRAKAVLTIGALGPKLAAVVKNANGNVFECGELNIAMAKAREIASEGDVVLLSTGCASYDQFPNFEKRGEEFARLARAITKNHATVSRSR